MACALVLFGISLFVTFFPEWFKMTNYDGNWGGKLMVRKGLWVKCTRVSPGMHNCDRNGFHVAIQNIVSEIRPTEQIKLISLAPICLRIKEVFWDQYNAMSNCRLINLNPICSYLSAIFGLPGYIVATRGTTILALLANLLTICSLFFVNFYSAKHRRFIIRVGGGLMIFGKRETPKYRNWCHFSWSFVWWFGNIGCGGYWLPMEY